MKIIINHPTSNQNNRAVLKGLFSAGLLYKFYTTIAAFSGSLLHKMSKFGPFKEISRRRFDDELRTLTVTSPYREFTRLLSPKLGLKSLSKHETGLFSVDAVYQNLDKKVALTLKKESRNGLDAIYAYEDGAYNSFKVAKENNITCLYDLPIGYWKTARKLLKKEMEVWPEWKATLHGFKDSDKKLKRKDMELALADHIFVASSFTAKTLEDYPEKLANIHVIPYGFPEPVSHRNYNIEKRPLKLLFVGGLSQRKGIANMFAAVNSLLPNVELTIVGRKSTNDCLALDNELKRHKWIPSLPHHQVLELMQVHDVLLFPSLFEGFGLVITEAMSQGTPVITTDRTAGPDLIEHDVNGWLVKAGSTQDLQECIIKLIENPEKIAEAGKKAIETARKRPWDVYGRELAEAIKAHCS